MSFSTASVLHSGKNYTDFSHQCTFTRDQSSNTGTNATLSWNTEELELEVEKMTH